MAMPCSIAKRCRRMISSALYSRSVRCWPVRGAMAMSLAINRAKGDLSDRPASVDVVQACKLYGLSSCLAEVHSCYGVVSPAAGGMEWAVDREGYELVL